MIELVYLDKRLKEVKAWVKAQIIEAVQDPDAYLISNGEAAPADGEADFD